MIDLDIPLINALSNISDPDSGADFNGGSIFNRANTDASGFPRGSEITLMRVAFERLSGTGFRAKELQDGFSSHIAEDMPNPPIWGIGKYPEAIWRGNYPKNIFRPLDAWVQDFCAVRNNNSHGMSAGSSYPAPIWSVHNHLLFLDGFFLLWSRKSFPIAGNTNFPIWMSNAGPGVRNFLLMMSSHKTRRDILTGTSLKMRCA